eukprot:CAMPEP_0184694332 /NCGR_PEP_ID=MMETSP0313-20130426/2340_1 /TAXON_ID=2792 /ORGANISM="Porphyridium aerugineum, Strain SAG 1380-2" /LENGTH=781 /DNA_ID=CAMNT_0027152619 /DNA_START=21 /DNA_END=2363 /DNA_ORIENTATION=+
MLIPQVAILKPGKVDVAAVYQHAAAQSGFRRLSEAQQKTLDAGSKELLSLRSEVYTACNLPSTPSSEDAATALIKYYKALQLVSERVDSTKQKELVFRWVASAKSSNTPLESNAAQFELCALLFNLAVIYAAIAAQAAEDRSVESLREGAKGYQTSAGFYRALHKVVTTNMEENHQWKDENSRFEPRYVQALETVMLANAQCLFYELGSSSSLSDDSVAKIAAGTKDLYNLAVKKLKECPNKPEDLEIACQIMAVYFEAEAESRMALFHEAEQDMAPRLKRLDTSLKLVYKARATLLPALNSTQPTPHGLLDKKAFGDTVGRRLASLDSELRKRLATAEEENQAVFLAIMADTVDRIDGRISVKSTVVDSLVDGVAVSKNIVAAYAQYAPAEENVLFLEYASKASQLVSKETQALNAALAQVEQELSVVEPTLTVEPTKSKSQSMVTRLTTGNEAALNTVKGAVQGGGYKALKDLEKQVMMMGEESKKKVAEIAVLLAREAADDASLCHKAASSSNASQQFARRQRSEQLNIAYHQACERIRGELQAAAKADDNVRHQIEYCSAELMEMDKVSMADLDVKTYQNVMSSTSESTTSLQQTLQMHVKELKAVLERGNALIRKFDSTLASDEPDPASIPKADGERNAFVAKRLDTLYANLQKEAKEIINMIPLLKQKIAADMSKTAETGDSDRAKFESRLQNVLRFEKSATTWQTLRGHLQMGMQFYSKEQENLTRLDSDVQGFVHARKVEADNIMSELTRSMGNMNMGGAPPAGYGAPPAGYG